MITGNNILDTKMPDDGMTDWPRCPYDTYMQWDVDGQYWYCNCSNCQFEQGHNLDMAIKRINKLIG